MAAAFPTRASTSNSTLIPTVARDADSRDAHCLRVDSGGHSTPILTPSQSSNGQPDTDSNPDFADDWHPSPATSNPGGYVGPTRRPSSLNLEFDRDRNRDRNRDIDRHAGEVIDGAPTINRSIREEGFAEMSTWAGQPHIKGSSEAMRMVLLTFNAIGITFTWGVEMTYCTPYLLNLGLTKSNTSLVWIAGPLSGLIVQPIVGVIADQSTSKWGRRRPFIVMGSMIAALSMIVLGFTQEIVGFFVADEKSARGFTITLAVLAIYAVDFAINAVMSCARSLIVDTLPIEKQQAGAAWSSRMSAMGHMMGYGAGAIDLVGMLGTTLGDTQFKQLTLIATFFILFSSGVSCWAVTERVLISTRPDSRKPVGRFKVFSQIWSTLLNLPPRIQAICWAQFWAWIGWFPFLFYSATWVGETYFRYDAPEEAKNSKDMLGDVGRIGSTALVIYSTVTLIGAWLLPMITKSPDDEKYTARPPQGLATLAEKFSKRKPDLMTVWMAGHLMFASAMFMAPFAASFRFATFLVVICGLPWTIAMWAPVTFLGVEVNKLSGATEAGGPAYRRLSNADDIELPAISADHALHLEHGSDTPGASSSTGELSGIYFGILNIYSTLPQFIGTFISTIVFTILEPGKSPELAKGADPAEHHDTDGPNAIAVCLFIGAISALGAAYATSRLRYL
ncbi:hypothetical protein VD0002_g6968 [Verticillium dahliae]|uniref:General alpha-glucoside permease n=1 Tax=Verticillium dahliae TaxID=27337 RepID=A0AA44WPY8_VERDA|nr:hypothetical protein VdG2_02927 [Verticillium dahliae VDG2]PNH34679.1 hypothetical protein BJF96_g2252 [Verticillium dahliae]PNH48787.1 hypothetical protein VD0003_g8337 [Verticillium dahliae]PNH60702.1 hypothetical protein VD0002_g6968 [Verticillium dahliae]